MLVNRLRPDYLTEYLELFYKVLVEEENPGKGRLKVLGVRSSLYHRQPCDASLGNNSTTGVRTEPLGRDGTR